MALDCTRTAFAAHDGCPGYTIPTFPDMSPCSDLDPARIHGMLASASRKAPIFDNLLPVVEPFPVELPKFDCALEKDTKFDVRFSGETAANESRVTLGRKDDTCTLDSVDIMLDLPAPKSSVTLGVVSSEGGAILDAFTGENTGATPIGQGDRTAGSMYMVITLSSDNVFAIS